MFYHMYRIWPLLVWGGFVVPGVRHVSGIDIYTPSEVVAVNGTNVRLKCTFSSSHRVVLQSVTVSWNYKPPTSGPEESVFYYQEVGYPPSAGRFKDHAVWSGDIARRDASITLQEVDPTFNGTYICAVRNPPDVHGSNGEIVLKVVNKVSLSEMGILAAAVGGACGAILIILGLVVAVRFYKKKQLENDIELPSQEYVKADPTACSPAEAVHLIAKKKEKEAVSSDEDESEPSSGDDDEDDGAGEDDEEDDDDDDDDLDDDDDD